ncbi:hypothetical protein [Saccharothrix luteola]|uniref:hypothetical protein n=1 Tax=Saccharothrix luteola TaxID=2893018 RepID=UPI0027E3302D|nr:hypothetical protein [Saccharothrix luteola]
MATDDNVAMARLLVEKLGVSPQQLLEEGGPRRRLPTFGEFIPTVSAVVPAGTLQVYSTYWRKILAAWGDRRLDEIEAMDVNWLVEHAKATVVVRRSGRGGHSAAEHAFQALRCLYRHAVRNRLMHQWDDPTELVRKPKRVKSSRRALDVGLVEQIVKVASTNGA